jgi:hypothetical protein
MTDLTLKLTKDTSMIDADINAIFIFEKKISEVYLLKYIVIHTFISHIYYSTIDYQMICLSEEIYVQH